MVITSITRPTGDYTSRDFDSWLIELRNKANAAFPAWTDFNTSNFGNVLLEMFSHTLDNGSFYQDQQHLERFATFLRLRRSAIALGKGFSFAVPGATVATVDLEITFLDSNPRISNVIIPKGTVVTTAEGDVLFETIADATILASTIQVTGVAARNAQEQNDPFVATGAPGYSFPLGGIPYVDGSATVLIGVDSWTLVDDFFSSGPTDKVFRVETDDQFRATVVFGDGTNGAIPSGSGSCTYLIGGGSSGNVDFDTLVQFRDGNRFSSLSGEFVQVSVRNPSKAGGGVDAMSVEEFRLAFAAFFRTVGRRSVSRQDFEDNARKVRGVARALMMTSDDDITIDENRGKLFIVPVGGGLPSSALQLEVYNFINDNYPPTITFQFTVNPPLLKIIPVTATVYLNRGVTEAVARAAIEASLDSLFSLILPDGTENPQIDFGFKIRTTIMPPGSVQGVFPWSTLFDALVDAVAANGAPVLRGVDKNSFVPANDIPVNDTEFPILGAILLVNGDTGLPF